MIRHYELQDDDLFALASGPAPPAILETLRSAELSKHMLLIRMIGASSEPLHDSALAVFEQARTSPWAARLLAHAWTGAWAVRCLRWLDSTGGLATPERLHFNALAAALAIESGLDADLVLPVRDAMAYLPTLGALRIGGNGDTHRLRVRSGTADAIPQDRERDTPGWLGHRWLMATAGDHPARTMLDDLSPYRDSFRLELTGRLTAAEFARWQRLWTDAWTLLAEHAPARRTELVACLSTAVPLSRNAGRAGFSATSRDAFGAFSLTQPSDGVNLAITIVHEGQHAKLNALLDLGDLHHVSPHMYFAPWREDARPIGGLLQGTYAFLGIADMWWRLSADPDLEQIALRQFALVREQVSVAADALEEAPELTRHGRLFVAGIRAALDRLLATDLPDGMVKRARASVRKQRATWRRANARASVR